MDELPAEVRKVLEGDPFARYLGVELVEVRPGYAVARLVVTKAMLNINGVTHGGVLFTLADTAFEAASNSRGAAALALNVNLNFVKACGPGECLTATATEENLTRRTGLYRILVVDGAGGLVAEMAGLVYRKDKAPGG